MNTKNNLNFQAVSDILMDLWGNHRGKMVGLIIGLLFGLLVITLGFWRSLFIGICMLIGFVVGKWVDEKTDWREMYQRIIKNR